MRLGPGGFHLHPHVRAGEWAAGLPPLEIQVPPYAISTGDSSGTRSAVLYFAPSCKIRALPVLSSPGKRPCVIEGSVCPRTSNARANPQKAG